MMRLDINPTDRLHMLVWRQHPSAEGNPGWRAVEAKNGVPLFFGQQFDTFEEALNAALERAGLR